jgi:RNA polymerase sigma factor (sigma-70 family)
VSDAQLLDRFVASRDEAAFELLVWRHGKMVMGTCQRLLRDPHEAEDAFQACFLALARRAPDIQRRQSIGAWLYRVASRLAIQGRTRKAWRRANDYEVDATPAADPGSDPEAAAAWREVRPLLDQAILELPDRFRAPFVLRHLEGWSNREIAHQLGCSEGTVESRLTRARQRMRGSLTRRGVTLGGVLFALAIHEDVATAAITKSLVLKTVQSAVLFTGSGIGAIGLSPKIIQLAQGALQAMLVAKVKFVGSLVLTGTLACGGVGFAAYQALASGTSSVAALGATGHISVASHSGDDAKRPQPGNKNDELLAPRLVHLVYKDTPLKEALADFKKQSGYDMTLSDPGNRLKGRKITLDTGKVSFWKALALFCEKGELMDNADSPSITSAPTFPGGGVAFAMGGGGAFTSSSSSGLGAPGRRILLTDGIPTPVAAFVDGSVRVRASNHLDGVQAPASSNLLIPLKITPEPRLDWLRTISVQIDKAVDDQGQTLQPADKPGAKPPAVRGAAIEPPVAGVPAVAVAPAAVAFNEVVAIPQAGQVNFMRAGNVVNESFGDASGRILLKKGAKPSTKLTELSGKVKSQVLGLPTALLTVTDVLDSVGKVGKTSDGGTFELVEANKSDDGKITISFILTPPAAAAAPAGVAGVAGVPAFRALPAAGAAPGEVVVIEAPRVAAAPAVNLVQGGMVVRQGFSMFGGGTNQEFNLYDDKGVLLPKTSTSIQSVRGRQTPAMQYKLTFDGSKANGLPSKFVYSSRSPVQVEVPFTLRNVNIPTERGEDQNPEE